MMEEVHKAVLKRKRVCNDDDVIVPDEIRDCNIAPILVQRFQIQYRWMSSKGSPESHFPECASLLFIWCSLCTLLIGDS